MGLISWVKNLFNDEDQAEEQPITQSNNAFIGEPEPIDLGGFELPDTMQSSSPISSSIGGTYFDDGYQPTSSRGTIGTPGISTSEYKYPSSQNNLLGDIIDKTRQTYITAGERMREAGIKRQEELSSRQADIANVPEIEEFVQIFKERGSFDGEVSSEDYKNSLKKVKKVIDEDPTLKERYGGVFGTQKLISDYESGYFFNLGKAEEEVGTVFAEMDERKALREKYERLGIEVPSVGSHMWHKFLGTLTGAAESRGTGLKIIGEKAERNLEEQEIDDVFDIWENRYNFASIGLGKIGENMEDYYGTISDTEQMKQIPDEVLGVGGYIGGNVASVVGSAAPSIVETVGTGGVGTVIGAYLEGSGDLYSRAEQIYADQLGKNVKDLTNEEKDLLLKASSEAGVVVSGTTYLSNKIGLGKTLAPFKKRILRESIKKANKEAGKKILQKSVGESFTKNYFKSVLSETLEEISQEGSKNLIIKLNEIDPNQDINENLVRTALETVLGVGLSFGLIEGGMSARFTNIENKKNALSAMPAKEVNITEDEGDVIAIEDTENNEVILKEVDPSTFEKDGQLEQSFVDKKAADVTLKLADIVGGKDAKKYQASIKGQQFNNYEDFVTFSQTQASEIIASKPSLEPVATEMASVIIGDADKVNVVSVQPIPEYKTDVKIYNSLTQTSKDDVDVIENQRYTQETETRLSNTMAAVSNSDFKKPIKSEKPKEYDNKVQDALTKEYQNIDRSVPIEKPKYLTKMAKKADSSVFEQSNVNKALSNEAYDKLTIDMPLTGNAKIDKLAINKIQKDLASIAKNELSSREVSLMKADMKSLQSRIDSIQETSNGILNQEAANMQEAQNIYNGKNLTEAPNWYAMFYRKNKRNATEAELLEIADSELERKANDPENEYEIAQDYVSLKQSKTILQGLLDSYETQLKKKHNRVDRYIVLSNSLKTIKSTESKIRKETYKRKEINQLNLQMEAIERQQGEEINSSFKNLTKEQRDIYKISTEKFVDSFKDPYIVKKVKEQKDKEDKITYKFVNGGEVDTLRAGETIYGRMVDMAQKKGYDKVEDYFTEITNNDKRIKAIRQTKTNLVKRILANNPEFRMLMKQKQSVKNQLDSISSAYKDKNRLIQAVNLKQLKRMRSLVAKRVLNDFKAKIKKIQASAKNKQQEIRRSYQDRIKKIRKSNKEARSKLIQEKNQKLKDFKESVSIEKYRAQMNTRLYKALASEYIRRYPMLKSIIIQFTDKRLKREAGKTRIAAMKLQDIENDFANKLDPYILQQQEIVSLVDKIHRERRAKNIKNLKEFNSAIGMPFLPEKDQLTKRDFKKLTKDKLERYYSVLQEMKSGETFVKESQIKYQTKDWFNLPESRTDFNNRLEEALSNEKEVQLFSRDENGNFVFQQNITQDNMPDFNSFEDPRIQIEGRTGRIHYPPEEGVFNAEDINEMLITNNAFFDYYRNKAIQEKMNVFEDKINIAIRDKKNVSVYSVDESGKEKLVKKLNSKTKMPDFFQLITEIKKERIGKDKKIVEDIKENLPFVMIGNKKIEMPRRQSRKGIERLFQKKHNTGIKFADRMVGSSQLAELDSFYDVPVSEFIRVQKRIENTVIDFRREYQEKYRKAEQSRKTHDVLDPSISTNELGTAYQSEKNLSKKTEIIAGATDIEKKFFQDIEKRYLEEKDYIFTLPDARVKEDYGMPMIPARLSDIIYQNKKSPVGLVKALRDWSNQEESIERSTFAKDFQDNFQNENVSASDVFNYAKKRTGLVGVVSEDYNYVNMKYFEEAIKTRILNEELPLLKSLIDFSSMTFDNERPGKQEEFKSFFKDHLDMLKGINPNLRDAKGFNKKTLKNVSAFNKFATSTALMFRLPTQIVNIVGDLSAQYSNDPIAFLRGLYNTSLITSDMVTKRLGYRGKIAENMAKIMQENPSLAGGEKVVKQFRALDKDIFDKVNLSKWIGYLVNNRVNTSFHTLSFLNKTERETGIITQERVAEIAKKKGQITHEDTSRAGASPWTKIFTALTDWRNTELMRTVNTARLSGKFFTETFDKIRNKEYDDVKSFAKEQIPRLTARWSSMIYEVGLARLRWEFFEFLVEKTILPEDEEDDNGYQAFLRKIFREANSRMGAIISVFYQAEDVFKEFMDLIGEGEEEKAFEYIQNNEQKFKNMFYAFGMRGYDKTNNDTILGDQFFVSDRFFDMLKLGSNISTYFDKSSLAVEKEKAKLNIAKEASNTTGIFGKKLAEEAKESNKLSNELFGKPFQMLDEENQQAYKLYEKTKDYSFEKKVGLITALESDKENKEAIELAGSLKVMFANEEFTDDEKEFLSKIDKKTGDVFPSAQTQGTKLYLYIKRNELSKEEEKYFLQRYTKNYLVFGITEEDSLATYSYLKSNNVEITEKEERLYDTWDKERGKEIAQHVKQLKQGKNPLTKEEEKQLIRTYMFMGLISNDDILEDYILEMGIDLKE